MQRRVFNHASLIAHLTRLASKPLRLAHDRRLQRYRTCVHTGIETSVSLITDHRWWLSLPLFPEGRWSVKAGFVEAPLGRQHTRAAACPCLAIAVLSSLPFVWYIHSHLHSLRSEKRVQTNRENMNERNTTPPQANLLPFPSPLSTEPVLVADLLTFPSHRKAVVRSTTHQMQITASWGGADVEVEVDEECRSLAALKRALRSALPEEVDLEKVCLEVGGRALSEEDVAWLLCRRRLLRVLSPRCVRRVVTSTLEGFARR